MDLQKLIGYDRHMVEWTNQHRIKSLDIYFIAITDTAYVTAILITVAVWCVALYRTKRTLKIKAGQMSMALISNTIVVTLLKYLINRQRPFVNDPHIIKLTSGGSPSFPSGHTADAFVIAMSFSYLFHEKIGLNILIWLWVFTVAYSRVVLGVHYVSDVFASAIIGSIVAIIVNIFFRNKYHNNMDAL